LALNLSRVFSAKFTGVLTLAELKLLGRSLANKSSRVPVTTS
jgi:hypothetical protein